MAPGRLLLTGFDAFGGATHNVSGAAARALDGARIGDAVVQGLQLPCVFDEAPRLLLEAIERGQPAGVLCLGLAPSRRGFWLERVAINLDDARIPDNAGRQPVDQPVVRGAPAAYFGTLPVKAMGAALQAEAMPAALSMSAGGYVCNHVFFALMHGLAARPGRRGGFMHLGADLDLAQVIGGVRIALAAALAHAEDLQVAAGAID